MAKAMKPMFLFHPDGKRNKTNDLLPIRIANAIKPMFLFAYPDGKSKKTQCVFAYPDGKRNKTFFFLHIRIANAIHQQLFVYIRMGDAIKPMFMCLSGWQTQ